VAVYPMTGDDALPGDFMVLDYGRSMVGMYGPSFDFCYVVGGMLQMAPNLDSLQTKQLGLMPTSSDNSSVVPRYEISKSYPITDKTILPYVMQSACSRLPVYWLEPTYPPYPPPKHGVSKRSVHRDRFNGNLILAFEFSGHTSTSSRIASPNLGWPT